MNSNTGFNGSLKIKIITAKCGVWGDLKSILPTNQGSKWLQQGRFELVVKNLELNLRSLKGLWQGSVYLNNEMLNWELMSGIQEISGTKKGH